MNSAAGVPLAPRRRGQLLELGPEGRSETEGPRSLAAHVDAAGALAAPVALLERDDVRVEALEQGDDAGELVAALDVEGDEAEGSSSRLLLRRRR